MAGSDGTSHSLDFFAIFALVVFAAVITFVIWPQRIVLRRPRAKGTDNSMETCFTIPFDFCTMPILAVLLLWATTTIGTQQIVLGIVGDASFSPYSIVILVFSLAYVSISLDLTGIFTATAIWAAQKSGNSGRRFFLYVYLLSSLVTIFASNDIVVLTLTPIIYYFAKVLNIDPFPFLMAEFHAANTWSSVLLIGNPTNLIVGETYDLGFFQYLEWMILPGILSSAVSFSLLFVIFRQQIPITIESASQHDTKPMDAVPDLFAAVYSSAVLILCLIALAVTSLWHIPVWTVTLPAAFLLLLRDVIGDRVRAAREKMPPPAHSPQGDPPPNPVRAPETPKSPHAINSDSGEQMNHSLPPQSLLERTLRRQSVRETAPGTPLAESIMTKDDPETRIGAGDFSFRAGSSFPKHSYTPTLRTELFEHSTGNGDVGSAGNAAKSTNAASRSEDARDRSRPQRIQVVALDQPTQSARTPAFLANRKATDVPQHAWLRHLYTFSPTAYVAMHRMPWKICPFVFSMFILVEALRHVGWVQRIATGLAGVLTANGTQPGGSIVGAIFMIGFFSAFAYCLLNNQPMSILFSQILKDPNFQGVVSAGLMQGSMFALILGSNFGGNLMLHAALAGIMWQHLLKSSGVQVRPLQFAMYGFIIVPPVIATGCLALWAEQTLFPSSI